MKWWINSSKSVVMMVPFVILMTSVRILITPLMLDRIQAAQCPADSYGFTLSERTAYANCNKVLTNSRGISYLANQTFPDGNRLQRA